MSEIYVSRDGVSTMASKIYCSYEGVTKLIYGNRPSIEIPNPVDIIDLDNFSKIAKSSDPNQYLEVGAIYKIPRGGDNYVSYRYCGVVSMPMQINGSIVTKNGLYLQRASLSDLLSGGYGYTSDIYGKYSESNLHLYIENTLKAEETADFLACLGDVQVNTSCSDGTTDTVIAKLFAPSKTQLGGGSNSTEGPVPPYYATGFAANRAIFATTYAQYWTRSYAKSGSYNSCVGVNETGGFPNLSYYSGYERVSAACVFIGK